MAAGRKEVPEHRSRFMDMTFSQNAVLPLGWILSASATDDLKEQARTLPLYEPDQRGAGGLGAAPTVVGGMGYLLAPVKAPKKSDGRRSVPVSVPLGVGVPSTSGQNLP